MHIKKRSIITITVLLLTTSTMFAGGYELNEQGARAVGMGGAFVATASDPSAIYYNPAGLAQQKGINLLLGGNLLIPSNTFKPTGTTVEYNAKDQIFTPVNLYGAYQVNDDIVVGIGVFNPFGLGIEWGDPINTKSDLQTWYINPSLGYKINDQISIGAGISYVYGKIKLSMPLMSQPVTCEGTGNNFNINFGAIYKPLEGLSIGLSYRMKTDIEFSGDLTALNQKGTAKATLPMPATLYLGVAYDATPQLKVEADIQYVQWSAYDKLVFKIDHPVLALMGIRQIEQEKDWVDNVTLRGGAEYKINEQTSVRGGLILDLTPQPPSKTELILPDADRVDISAGITHKLNENLYIDLSYMAVLFMERDAKYASPSGIYNCFTHVISLNIGYTF